MPRLTIRLSEQQLQSLRTEADRSGFPALADYARRKLAVSTAIERIADRLDLQEQRFNRLEQLILERTAEIESRLGGTAPSLSSLPSQPLVLSGPQPFDRTCYEADMHRPGQVCPDCGGSFYPKAR